MDKCGLHKILLDTSKELNDLIAALEDESLLCVPGDYDCSRCINDLISLLKQGRKYSRNIADTDQGLSDIRGFCVMR